MLPRVVGALGRGGQQFDRVGGDGAGDALDRSELATSSAAVAVWWARSSRPAGKLAIALATPAWRRARAALVSVWYAASRTESLRNSHRRPRTSSRPRSSSSRTVGRIELLAELVGKRLQRGDRSRGAERRRVLDDLSLSG